MSPRKNNDDAPEEKDYTDKIGKTVRVTTSGMHLRTMIENARASAAQLIDEPPEHLYVLDHSRISVTETARFEPTPRVTELTIDVTFGVIPEAERPKPELTVVPMPDRRSKKR